MTERTDNIVVAGRSGAGKQPRIDVLVKELGLTQLSTGNIFREFVGAFDSSGFKNDIGVFFDQGTGSFVPDKVIEAALRKALPGTKEMRPVVLGLKAKYFMNRGLFVPDIITNELFAEYFSRGSYRGQVLDGYPRTPEQASFLLDLCRKQGTRLDLVVEVENDDSIIIERTMGRRICKACGKVYHIQFKPSKDGRSCDKCGSPLIQRSDDTEERIRTRLKEYYDKVVPAMELLRKHGVPVVKVPGNVEPFTEENVRRSVMDALAPYLRG